MDRQTATGAGGVVLRLAFALGIGALALSLIAGFAYLIRVQGALPLMTDPLQGAREQAARGDLPGAVREVRSYVRLSLAPGSGLDELGQVLLQVGRFEDAASAFESSLRGDGRNVRALSGLAQARLAQRRFEEAAALYERAARISGRDRPYREQARRARAQGAGEPVP